MGTLRNDMGAYGGGNFSFTKEAGIPESFDLFQNYPNPFNQHTTIWFTVGGGDNGVGARLSSPIPVELSIYNILGQKVTPLVSKKLPQGIYRKIWDGRDDQGRQVSSGVYFYRLKTRNFHQVKKLVLVR
jgi:hypothetical protein